jgi:hypothetical protein
MSEHDKIRMADILKPCASEHFMVDIFEVLPEDVARMRLADLMKGMGEYHGFKAGKYARLSHREPNGARGATIMSDTWMERMTNEPFIQHAKGHVLIAGLGIGMVLLDIQDKEDIFTVTVVEKEEEVIDLVRPQLPLNSKVRIIPQDIFKYKATDKTFDTIYFDIWDGITADNYPEMKTLHRRFGRKLKPGGWMASWRRKACQERYRDR